MLIGRMSGLPLCKSGETILQEDARGLLQPALTQQPRPQRSSHGERMQEKIEIVDTSEATACSSGR